MGPSDCLTIQATGVYDMLALEMCTFSVLHVAAVIWNDHIPDLPDSSVGIEQDQMRLHH